MSNPLSGAPSSGVNPAFTQTSSTAGAQKSTTKPSSVENVASTILQQMKLSQDAIKQSKINIEKHRAEGGYHATNLGGAEYEQDFLVNDKEIDNEEQNIRFHEDKIKQLNDQYYKLQGL